MLDRYLPLCAATLMLAGCAGGTPPSVQEGARPGYWYHDGNHHNSVSQSSPQADYNATHGTWLWPPAENDKPGA
jgi:hypothetical protein